MISKYVHRSVKIPSPRQKFPSVLPPNGPKELEGLTVYVESQVEKSFFNETTVTVSQIMVRTRSSASMNNSQNYINEQIHTMID